MADLFLMCGVPGSGKSTYLKERVKDRKNCIIVSRDEIRFSLLQPGEDYFSHEDEVYKELWKRINEGLAADKNVFVDQTSLTPKARKYLLNHVTGYDSTNAIWINENLETCLERNEKRKGTRAYVPRGVIRRMYSQFIEPTLEEGFDFILIHKSEEEKEDDLF